MRREHASGVTRVNIFTHNGAPQALVGCLATSVGRYPADSGIEGSPGRDRASGLAQFWNGLLRATTPFVMAAIDLNASTGGGLNMLGDCPGKTRQFSSDRGRDHGG